MLSKHLSQVRRYRIKLGRKAVYAGFLTTLLFLLLVTPALAHPLGNFTINRYSRLTLHPEQVELFYVVDMAEIPTHRQRTSMDQDGNGEISQAEQQTYEAAFVESLRPYWQLTLGQNPLSLKQESIQLAFAPGQANLPTLRVEIKMTAVLPKGSANDSLRYEDNNFAGQLGWQEVWVQAEVGVQLINSSVPTRDQSQELRKYPSDLLSTPLTVHQAQIEFAIVPVGQNQQPTINNQQSAVNEQGSTIQNPKSEIQNITKPTDGFAELITWTELTPMTMLLALFAAFGWGALHALSPGHGKTIVGAYLVGTRGTVRHALFLGLTTTVTHTIGIFLLGFITLFASRYVLPERLYPWLGVFSGLLVVLMGLSLSWSRLRSYLGLTTAHAAHAHSDSSLYHDHGDGHYHTHLPAQDQVTWGSLLALGVSGGLLPCPSALVLMLAAISLQRIGFGLLLILIFSLGLASVLSCIGILLVRARTLFERTPITLPFARVLPIASAVLITILGIGITWQAFLTTGFWGKG